MRDAIDEVQARLSDLNRELDESHSEGRIRYVRVQPDPDFADELLVIATWEIPASSLYGDDSSRTDLDTYCVLLAEKLDGIANTHCLFRTPNEIKASPQLGVPIRQPA